MRSNVARVSKCPVIFGSPLSLSDLVQVCSLGRAYFVESGTFTAVFTQQKCNKCMYTGKVCILLQVTASGFLYMIARNKQKLGSFQPGDLPPV